MKYRPLEIDPGLPEEESKQTIHNVIDAIVELVTNSSDSYRRLGITTGGVIEIYVSSSPQFLLEELSVRDDAEGMDEAALEAAMRFGKSASGFDTKKGIRGLFGRGLKQAILALGEGNILTRQGEYVRRLTLRRKSGSAGGWEWGHEPLGPAFAEKAGLLCRRGTIVRVIAKPEKNSLQRWRVSNAESLIDDLRSHFAIRHLLDEMDIQLRYRICEPKGRGQQTKLQCEPKRLSAIKPQGELRISEVKKVGDHPARVTIWESPEKLPGRHGDPCSMAGVIITTENVPIDLKVFDGSESHKYFFGVVEIPAIAKTLREGDRSILSTSRLGLNWKNAFAKQILRLLEDTLAPLVADREARTGRRAPTSDEEARVLSSDRNFLNRLAKQLDLAPEGVPALGGADDDEPDEVTQLVLKPEVSTIRPGESRRLSAYLPARRQRRQAYVNLTIESPDSAIILVERRILLRQHASKPNLLCGTFKVNAKPNAQVGDFALIECNSENETPALGEIRVGEPGKRKKGEKLQMRKGGFLSEIVLDREDPDPSQRVVYASATGTMIIYTRFPGLEMFREHGVAISSEPALTLYSELLAEGLCKAKCLLRFERGEVPTPGDPESAIANCFSEYDRLRKKCLKPIRDHVGRSRSGSGT